jgi:hypothetical protein
MPTYAVTLGGVPARIMPTVLTSLRARYSDNHAFRGEGARLYNDGLANYHEEYVSRLVATASENVFGTSARPKGFCRNPGRGCALIAPRKDSCLRNPSQTCYLQKPDFLLLLYQAGHSEEALFKRLHHSVFSIQLSQGCYDRAERTIGEAVEAIRRAVPLLDSVRTALNRAKKALLLPPLNFGRGPELEELFRAALQGDTLAGQLQSFRADHFLKSRRAYRGRNKLAFRPGTHGVAGDELRDELALSKVFRLGCQYDNNFHWDVSRLDCSAFDGSITFHCRRGGPERPSGPKHVNVLVDDCLR